MIYTNKNLKSRSSRIPKTKREEELEKMKFEIAKELGLYEKVEEGGWSMLTAKETGKIGGIMHSRMKNKDKSCDII